MQSRISSLASMWVLQPKISCFVGGRSCDFQPSKEGSLSFASGLLVLCQMEGVGPVFSKHTTFWNAPAHTLLLNCELQHTNGWVRLMRGDATCDQWSEENNAFSFRDVRNWTALSIELIWINYGYKKQFDLHAWQSALQKLYRATCLILPKAKYWESGHTRATTKNC